MRIDFADLAPAQRYRLLAATVTPRPIALVSTWSAHGGDNAAPYSFFNVMGEDPPALVLGLEATRGTGTLKDTTINIRDQGEFVVHMVDEPLADAMNLCALPFPPGTSEAALAGLALVPSSLVRPRRIAAAPVAFECERLDLLPLGPNRFIAVGKVLAMHVRDGLMDPATQRIDTDLYQPVGRLCTPFYTRTRDRFALEVPPLPGA
ncbi:MAG TPA: flavin reductase family protein [Ramlibacter sp.]|uniref:flavin reductase family protein n=1 Tax=Ramlibacter sp. TaxID=1917967 RepID=UPI002D374DD4|nr:flavin reductase family protein [Ramlibacter sp.]HZY17827.1 flavin reductase family protein [Ramlibacter sp.]